MTKYQKHLDLKEEDLKEFNNFCEECKNEDKSVSQNLVLIGLKICESCRLSKNIFPIEVLLKLSYYVLYSLAGEHIYQK